MAGSERYQPYRQDVVRPRQEKPISKRESEILRYIEAHIKKFGFAPAHRDITRHFGLKSSRSAACHLRELEAKGFIEMKRGVARSIRVLV